MSKSKLTYTSETKLGDDQDEGDNKIRKTTYKCVEILNRKDTTITKIVLEFSDSMTSTVSWERQDWHAKHEISRESFLEEFIEFTLEVNRHYARK